MCAQVVCNLCIYWNLIMISQSNETLISNVSDSSRRPSSGRQMTTTETKNRRKLNSNTGTVQEWLMTYRKLGDTTMEKECSYVKKETKSPTNGTLLRLHPCSSGVHLCECVGLPWSFSWCWMNLDLIFPHGSRRFDVGDSIHVLLWLTSQHSHFWLRPDVVWAVWIDDTLSHRCIRNHNLHKVLNIQPQMTVLVEWDLSGGKDVVWVCQKCEN